MAGGQHKETHQPKRWIPPVIRQGADDYVFVLVPSGRQIDRPKLRSHLGVKRLSLPSADVARPDGSAPTR